MINYIKKINSKWLLFFALLPWPVLAFQASNLADLVKGLISGILNPIIVVLVSLAVIYFIWNTIVFIKAEDKKREDARVAMIYSLIGLTVMVSFWGLVFLLQTTFQLNNTSSVRDQIKGVYNSTL